MFLFLSYAREDFPYANKIYQYLSKKDYNIWMDIYNIKIGEKWKTSTISAINNSDGVIVLLSESSINKIGYFQKEVGEMIERSKYYPDDKIFIYPIVLDDSAIPSSFEELNVLRINKNLDQALQILLSNLESNFSHELSKIRNSKRQEDRNRIVQEILEDSSLLESIQQYPFIVNSPEQELRLLLEGKFDFFRKKDLIKREGESRFKRDGEIKEYNFVISLNEEGEFIRDLVMGKLNKKNAI